MLSQARTREILTAYFIQTVTSHNRYDSLTLPTLYIFNLTELGFRLLTMHIYIYSCYTTLEACTTTLKELSTFTSLISYCTPELCGMACGNKLLRNPLSPTCCVATAAPIFINSSPTMVTSKSAWIATSTIWLKLLHWSSLP